MSSHYDATALESIDPNLWFKLASSARCLDSCLFQRKHYCSTSMSIASSLLHTQRKYKESEHHALQMGYKALNKHTPCNMLINLAIKDCNNEIKLLNDECSMFIDLCREIMLL